MPRALTWDYGHPENKPKMQMYVLDISAVDSVPCWTRATCPVDFTEAELAVYAKGEPGCLRYNYICIDYAERLGIPYIQNIYDGMFYNGPKLSDVEMLALLEALTC
jgi:hypothetical protein